MLVAGTYGMGKTRLLHFLGRLFSVEAPSDDFTAFLNNIDDVTSVKLLNEVRSNSKPWLVVVPTVGDEVDFYNSMREAAREAESDARAARRARRQVCRSPDSS